MIKMTQTLRIAGDFSQIIISLARRASYSPSYWLRAFHNDPKIEKLNGATKRVTEEDYDSRVATGFGFYECQDYLFPQLTRDIFDFWRNGSAKERELIFGKKASELEGRVECATLTPAGEFRVWYNLPSSIYLRGIYERGNIPHVSEGSNRLLFDTSATPTAISALSSFLSIFEDFGRCKTYRHGIIVFSPSDYREKNLLPQDQNHYALEKVDS